MWASGFLAYRSLAMLIATAISASTLILLRFPEPARPAFRLGEIFAGTLRNVVRTSREPQFVTGFLLFLAPASCVAAINLFGGLGSDFHSSPQPVVWVTGAGVAIASAMGSTAGGYIADRVNRGVLYLSGGVLAGVCALIMAMTPHTQLTFTAGVLVYNAIAGVTYAGFSALGLQLVGTKSLGSNAACLVRSRY